MKSVLFVLLALLGCASILAQNAGRSTRVNKGEPSARTSKAQRVARTSETQDPTTGAAVEKGAKWLASVQGADGGWGQDGGEPTNVRQGQSLESTGNDVANTALAALALLRAGNQYATNVERALDFILKRIEASPGDGLAITNINKQTQVQRKLGPYIDTFLSAMLLAQVDGTFNKPNNVRVRKGLERCVAKIQRNQTRDGSWNAGGGWAPLLGTSLASRSLYEAGKKGVAIDQSVLARADAYTLQNQKDRDAVARGSLGRAKGSGSSIGGVGAGAGRGLGADGVGGAVSSAAGVALYQDAQALEQLSRTSESRIQNSAEISAISRKLADTKFVEGYGSIGGGILFLSQHQRRFEALRRQGMEAMVFEDLREDSQASKQRWYVGRSPLHHRSVRGDQRGDTQPDF